MEQNKILEEQIHSILLSTQCKLGLSKSDTGVMVVDRPAAAIKLTKVAQRYALEQQIELLDKIKRDPDASITAYYLEKALKKELEELNNGTE